MITRSNATLHRVPDHIMDKLVSQVPALNRGNWKAYIMHEKVYVYETTSDGEAFGHTFEVNFDERTLTPIGGV